MRNRIIIFSVFLAALLAFSGLFDNEAMYGKIHADAQGYYGYLVAVFIEQSFDWEQVIHSYADVYFDGGGADFTVTTDLGRINKYYVGTAVLMLPFFLLSCIAAWLLGYPIDGYSIPFQQGVMFGALFYSGMGMYFLARFLEDRGIRPLIAVFASVMCLFATPLFHYTISEPAMSHAYSFGLFGAFLFFVNKWFSIGGTQRLLLSVTVFALVVLVRPANGLLILSVPFISGGFIALKDRLFREPSIARYLAFAAVLVVAILGIQSAMYVAQVGKALVWSYQGEGFDFSDPETVNFLISYKKGLFVYTPFAFVGLLGLIFFAIKKPKEGIWLLVFLSISVYVLSCWWNWYYGSSLGMRAMVEFMPFFAVGVALLLNDTTKSVRILIIAACLFFGYLNLVQSYQYQKFILHWVGMDQDRYWQIFLKTDRKYDGIFYREEQKAEEEKQLEFATRVVFESDLEEGTSWGNQGITTEMSVSGKRSTLVNAENPYGSTLGVNVSELGPDGDRKLRVTANVWSEDAFPKLSIAYSFRGPNGDYGHDYIGVGQFITESETWIKVETVVSLKQPVDSLDNWIVYPLNTSDMDVYLDDIKYEVLTLKSEP